MRSLFIATLLLLASSANAQQITAPAAVVKAPTVGDYKISAGIKSTNTAARGYELSDDNGRRYKLKNEYYLGATHTSGWGLSGMAVTSGTSYADSSKNKFGAGDPSLTLIHPALYDSGTLKFWGQLRRYFPVTNFSNSREQHQYAYYLFTTYKLPANVTVFNQLTPRYFEQSIYKTGDTTAYVEDYTTITKTAATWFKYGMGQHSQMEWHKTTAQGSSVELYPFVDFVLNGNVFIEPKVYLPIYKDKAVYDSPRKASLDNYQAEVYAQISM